MPPKACNCASMGWTGRLTQFVPKVVADVVARVLCVTQFGVAGTEADRPLATALQWLVLGRQGSRVVLPLSHLHALFLLKSIF